MAIRSPSPPSRPGKERERTTRLAPRAQTPRVRRKAAAAGNSMTTVTPEERHRLVAEAAYFIAERRGFAAGYELDDWLQAEAEVDRRLDASNGPAGTN